MPLMMIGGLYLCFEGFEKVAHKLLHSAGDDATSHAKHVAAVADPNVDLVAFERGKVKGAIRTDFVLSAEIIVITLGTMAAAPLLMKSLSILGTAAMFTVGGGIIAHGVPPVAHIIEGIDASVAERSALLATAVNMSLDAIVGIVAGGLAVLVFMLGKRVAGRK